MIELFNLLLYQPLFNGLIFLYHYLPGKDMGVAIIVLTTLIKVILFPPSLAAIRSQQTLRETQPKIDALKKQYQGKPEELGKKMIAFYRENRVNPFSSCLPLLVQLPILIALYQVFLGGLKTNTETGILLPEQVRFLWGNLKNVYQTQAINPLFLGIVNISKSGNWVLAVIAGLLQFWQTKMMTVKKPPIKSSGSRDEGITTAMNRQMLYFMPALTIVFGAQFPAGLTLYWVVSTLLTIVQQQYFFRAQGQMVVQPQEKKA